MTQIIASVEDVGTAPKVPARWAWGLCWLLFAATALNYVDRQAMALVGEQIKGEFRLSNEAFGWVLAAFSLSYAMFQVPAGYLADRRNVRWLYAGAVVWWSAAGAATAFAPTVGVLMICRGLLGFGESLNWPCALRVTATVLPPADRGLANGIFNSGAAVGAVLGPLLVTPLAARCGWRAAFAVVGSLGLFWVVAWLALIRGPRAHLFAGRSAKPAPVDDWPASSVSVSGKGATGRALRGLAIVSAIVALSAVRFGLPAIWWGVALLMVGGLAVAGLLPVDEAGPDWARSLGELVRLRRFWVVIAVGLCVNLCWHFLVNWLPSYLKQDRGMTFLRSGLLTAVPFLAADAGNLLGGGLSRSLARRGLSPARARFRTMAICALLASAGAWVGVARSDTVVIVLLAVMALGTASYMANNLAACQEVSTKHTGLVVGLQGGLGNLFVAGFLPIAGKVKDVTGGFGPVFVVVGLLPFLGLGALWLGWREAPGEPVGSD